jgi:hypothetical protein
VNGFIVQGLAEAMRVNVPEALEHLRRLLAGGPEETGVREPRRPTARLPSMAAERDLGDDAWARFLPYRSAACECVGSARYPQALSSGWKRGH